MTKFITMATIITLAILPPSVTLNAPASASGGGSMEASGSSDGGESSTRIDVYHDGVQLTSGVTITWSGNDFSIAIDPVPDHDPEGDNIIEIDVSSGATSVSAAVTITKA